MLMSGKILFPCSRHPTGAVFSDLQLFENAGAWHSSERSFFVVIFTFSYIADLCYTAVFEIFGTFPSDATDAEKTLSLTMQNIVANFARNPTAAPAPNWPEYVPGNTTNTLAKLAFSSNVMLSDVVQTAASDSLVSYAPLFNSPLSDGSRAIGLTLRCFVE
jgi:hypothetical protein